MRTQWYLSNLVQAVHIQAYSVLETNSYVNGLGKKFTGRKNQLVCVPDTQQEIQVIQSWTQTGRPCSGSTASNTQIHRHVELPIQCPDRSTFCCLMPLLA